ncbi:MAG: hypothetical protein ACPG52_12775 [Cognaticolwellia sp.]
MTSLQVAEKKEKSLAEILVVVVLVGLLMTSFIYYFFKQQEQLTRAGFENIAQVFSARVNGIHAQWFMDQQPNVVYVASNNTPAHSKIKIPVNSAGWVYVDDALVCQEVWQYVMEAPLLYMKESVGAVLVEQKKSVGQYCRYSLPSGEYFTYHINTGKVSAVKVTS